MIDIENLRTASQYINNQLLSRGLLRDGDSIDLAKTVDGDEESVILSGRIISIINDLILRRDRDAEQRESLASTMRSLRMENTQLNADVNRLTDKHAEAQRKADIAAASAATSRTQLKSAEASTKALKDDVARMKSLVSQTRAACATEIRRRDRQIDALKKQLGEAGRSRGSRGNPAVTTITVTGETGREKASPNLAAAQTITSDSDLRNETNTTLAAVAHQLTEENDAMVDMIKQTMTQLQDMSGWSRDDVEDAQVRRRPSPEDMAADLASVTEHMKTILTNPSFVPIEEVVMREEEINRLKTGWVKMESRWKDAVHLMDGWRKRMATSGKPVCDAELRMGMRLSPVRVHDVDETRAAGPSILSAVKEEEAEEEVRYFSGSPCPANQAVPECAAFEELDDAGGQSESGDTDYGDDAPFVDDNDGIVADRDHGTQSQSDESIESIPLPPRPELSPLGISKSAGNRGISKDDQLRPRLAKPRINQIGNMHDQTLACKSMRSQPLRPRTFVSHSKRPSKARTQAERPRSPSRTSLDDVLLTPRHDAGAALSAQKSHVPQSEDELEQAHETVSGPPTEQDLSGSPRNPGGKQHQSPMITSNIASKLAATEKEAHSARLRAKIRAARESTRGVSRPTLSSSAAVSTASVSAKDTQDAGAEREDAGDPMKQDTRQVESQAKPEKRKRDRKMSKTASRRRSTLSPWELETLISGQAQ